MKIIKENLDLFILLLLVPIFFISLCPISVLDPCNVSFIYQTSGDFIQNYLGSVVWRSEEWGYPLFEVKSLFISLIGTDSNPLFSFIFKVITKLFGFSPKIQFFGIFILFNLFLNAIASVLIFRHIFKKDCFYTVLSSLFFIFSPIFLDRLYEVHINLTAHWLILFSFLVYLNDRLKIKQWLEIYLIVILSLFIHPYFLPMSLGILSALILKKILKKEISSQSVLWGLSFLIMLILLSVFILCENKTNSAGGYNNFSMNLNALFNPMGKSLFLPDFKTFPGQYEGDNYLGFGLILIALLNIKSIKKYFTKENINKNKEILLIFFVFFYYSLSNILTLGQHKLFYTIPFFPNFITQTFRSCGRFFWPCWYILGYFLIQAFVNQSFKYKKFIFSLFVAIQLLDLSGYIINKRNSKYNTGNIPYTFYTLPYFDTILTKYNNVFLLSTIYYPLFWIKASEMPLSVYGGYFTDALRDKDLDEKLKYYNMLVDSGILPKEENAIFILSKNLPSDNPLSEKVQQFENIYFILSD